MKPLARRLRCAGPRGPGRNRIFLQMQKTQRTGPADPRLHPSRPICTQLLASLKARFIGCALPCPDAQFSMSAAIPQASSLPASPASRRDADRKRKRVARQFLRELGAPDPRQLDAAIVNALRDVLLSSATSSGTRPGERLVSRDVDTKEVLRIALRRLRGRESGGMSLQPEAIRAALVARLAPPSKATEA